VVLGSNQIAGRVFWRSIVYRAVSGTTENVGIHINLGVNWKDIRMTRECA